MQKYTYTRNNLLGWICFDVDPQLQTEYSTIIVQFSTASFPMPFNTQQISTDLHLVFIIWFSHQQKKSLKRGFSLNNLNAWLENYKSSFKQVWTSGTKQAPNYSGNTWNFLRQNSLQRKFDFLSLPVAVVPTVIWKFEINYSMFIKFTMWFSPPNDPCMLSFMKLSLSKESLCTVKSVHWMITAKVIYLRMPCLFFFSVHSAQKTQ